MSDKCKDNINVWDLEDPYRTDFFPNKQGFDLLSVGN